MILFLTLIYIGVLFTLVKMKLIKMTLWWKLSPVAWSIFLMIVLFIPMQFWAPAGDAVVLQNSIPIVPNVGGQVTEVAVDPNQTVKKGDLLFKIDPTIYEANRDQLLAQLELAKMRLKQSHQLRLSDAVSAYELEQFQAQVKQLEAGLKAANWSLEQTEVRAPADGFITNLALRPGMMVASLPLTPAMTLVENSEKGLVAAIPQGYLRLIEPGQYTEITFNLFPGKIFTGKVKYVVNAVATGQISASGSMVSPQQVQAAPFVVRLTLDDESLINNLPAGAVGTIAVYTESGAPTHVIRKVMIRMDAYINYLLPF